MMVDNEPIEFTFVVADASFKEIEIKIRQGSKLKSIVIETGTALDNDSEKKTFALRESSQAAIGNPTTAGTILYDSIRLGISTNGAFLQNSRYEYQLKNRRVKNRENVIYFHYYNATGSTDNVRVVLEYDDPD